VSSTFDARMVARPVRPPAENGRGASDAWIYLLLTVLTLGAWRFSRLGLFRAGDDIGYWLGVAGGSMMLLLFTYPLRKYVRALHRLGKVKGWFIFHMVLGICGPLLILVHSTFRVGSLNAAVAMYSMIVVVVSGVVGRFIYLHIHRGLSGERLNLNQLKARAGLDQSDARSRLHFAPKVEQRLLAFAAAELKAPPGWATWLRQVLLLPAHMWAVYLRCALELRAPLHDMALRRQWSRADLSRRKRLSRKLARRYLTSVVKVAQFTAYERLFRLWHLAHVPFLYLLVISAVVHVIAVHAY